MKGFIKILESIIASIIILSSITFFFSFQRPAELQQPQFNYILPTLQKNTSLNDYVKSNDAAVLNTSFKNMLPSTVDFSVEIRGIPSPVIKIGCVCSNAEKNDLTNRLAPLLFQFKSRTIETRIDNGSLADMANSDAYILLFFGPRTFTSDEQTTLREFLKTGSLFMIADLDQPDVDGSNPNVVMDDIFGLSWGLIAASTGKFVDTETLGNVSNRISRYYNALGGDRKSDEFVPRIVPLLTKNKIVVDGRTIVGDPIPASITSLVKINEIGNSGRTVWFIGYDPSCPPPPALCTRAEKMNRLLKSTVLWASGESYKMDPRFKIIPPAQSFRQYNYISVLDEFEPYMISLKIWNVFF